MANFDQNLAVFFLFFTFWCVISVNCGRFHQITHRNQHLYHQRAITDFLTRFLLKNAQKRVLSTYCAISQNHAIR